MISDSVLNLLCVTRRMPWMEACLCNSFFFLIISIENRSYAKIFRIKSDFPGYEYIFVFLMRFSRRAGLIKNCLNLWLQVVADIVILTEIDR